MYHLIPSNIREQKWQEFLQDQLQDHRIAHIREEIISIAITNGFEKNHFEKKLFEFNSLCARIVWLRLFNWVFSALDSYQTHCITGKAIHLIVDIEPQSLPMDSWIFKNVSQILTQKPSPQILISPFPSITSIKLSNHHVEKKKQHQIKSKNINRGKLKPNNKEKITSSKAKKLHDTIHEMKKTNRYLKKNINSLSLHEQRIVNSSTENKNDKSNNIEKNKINIFEKNLKYNRNNNDNKSNFNNNPKSKQEDITNISRLSKNIQQNETIALYDKETAQFQPLSNRVEVLYTILPDHTEKLDSNNSIK